MTSRSGKRGLDGTEAIGDASVGAVARVVDFWRWAASDLVSNTLRGQFAEFLVATALGAASGVRAEWDDVDVRVASIGVEVKSASYVQTWSQAKPSAISFDISPTRGWNAATNEYSATVERRANVYVFALLGSPDRIEVDPLDLDEWRFFVLPTRVLDERVPAQKRITLAPLRGLGAVEVGYATLAEAVRAAVAGPT